MMKIRSNNQCLKFCNILCLYLLLATISFTQCDAKRSSSSRRLQQGNAPSSHRSSFFLITAAKLNLVKYLNYDSATDDSPNSGSYSVSSPLTLPPYDSLAPISLPQNAPPYCIYPPSTPQAPSTTIPSPTMGSTPPFYNLPPVFPIQNPPPSPYPNIPFVPSPTNPNPPDTVVPSPPEFEPSPTNPNPPDTVVPSPPEFEPSPTNPNPPDTFVPSPPEFEPSPTNPNPPDTYVPGPPEFVPSPSNPVLSPPYYEPSPPGLVPSPPSTIPSPFGFIPSPPMFLPPIVYPPPRGPPPRNTAPNMALWCVAKPSVPDPIIQEAMNYACGSGADCDSIQPSGSCFKPNTLLAHASFAFNSYFQRTKVAGGTCEFGGTAMLVTVDPSYDGCHFVYV